MRPANGFSLVAIIILLLLGACGGGSSDDAIVTPEETNAPPETLTTIKIGNITDLTGPGAGGMELVNMALEDIVRYYNENNLIPGVELKVIHWDGQTDPARIVPRYELLKHQGVQVFTTCAPGVAVTLKPRLEAEKEVLFSQVGEMEAIEPPGRVFCLGTVPENEAYTFLDWIAKYDWDYRNDGPARIGAAAWAEPYAIGFVKAMKEYAKVHPEQFQFVEGYLPEFKFNWSSEIESLKKCDYVFPPIIVHQFARDIRNTGSEARLIGGAPHTAFFDMVSEADAWPAIDGMLFIYTGSWWHEDDKLMIIAEEILRDYHPDNAEDIISRGSSYGGIGPYLMLCDIIAKTVEKTGPEGFNSEALYQTAQSWSYPLEHADYNYGPEKRYMINALCVLEASAEKETVVKNDPNWYPVLTEP
ncbi:MAG: ABC transporter substrate-binding protein [Dehalococcoidia bacterium]